MPLDQYAELVSPYIRKAVSAKFDERKIAAILQPRANTLMEIPEMLDFFDQFPAYSNDLYVNKKMKTTEAIALQSLQAAREALAGVADWQAPVLHDLHQ